LSNYIAKHCLILKISLPTKDVSTKEVL